MITVHADDVKFTASGLPDSLKPQLDAGLKTMGEHTKTKLNDNGKNKFAWVDDNKFTLTGKENKPETFTRVK